MITLKLHDEAHTAIYTENNYMDLWGELIADERLFDQLFRTAQALVFRKTFGTSVNRFEKALLAEYYDDMQTADDIREKLHTLLAQVTPLTEDDYEQLVWKFAEHDNVDLFDKEGLLNSIETLTEDIQTFLNSRLKPHKRKPSLMLQLSPEYEDLEINDLKKLYTKLEALTGDLYN